MEIPVSGKDSMLRNERTESLTMLKKLAVDEKPGNGIHNDPRDASQKAKPI